MKRLLLLLMLVSPALVSAQKDRPLFEQYVLHYAHHYNVQPELIAAIIDVESSWSPNAVSSMGAMGLMQLMPRTARRFGAFRPFDPEQNIAAGTRYVTSLMWEYRGDLRLVAAAYHADDRYIRRKQLAYSNPEVIAYVEAVRRHYMARTHAAALLPRR